MEYRKQIDTSEELGKWYDEKYKEMGDGWNTPAEEINQHLDDLGVPFDQGKRLLDVGCGAGHFLVEACKRVNAHGIDISACAMRYAYRRGIEIGRVQVFSIEAQDGVFADGSWDYIVSLGSLEHVIDIDKALDNIRALLKPDGKFYFFCPNETWKHFDQPNERAMTDSEWMQLFNKHGLYVTRCKRWNDSTAFTGEKDFAYGGEIVIEPPNGNKLNIGSGQRRFDTAHGWINVDCVSRPGQVPDLLCDVGKEKLPYPDNSMEYVVLNHVYEHLNLGNGHGIIKEAFRVLKSGGSLIVTVPNIRALAQRWLTGQISDYIFFVNIYGAYQSEEGDLHRWGYTLSSLREDISSVEEWSKVGAFDWEKIAGSDIPLDWWIMGIRATK